MFRRRQERRAQYRVRASEAERLEAHVRFARGAALEARILDTSGGGARLAVPGLRPPAVGTKLDVSFVEIGVGRPIVAQAQVVAAGREGEGTTLRVQFTAPEAFHRHLTPALWTVFNRRRAPRAVPPKDAPLWATVSARDEVFALAVRDLSVDGIGLDVPTDRVAWLEPVDELRLATPLPDRALEPLLLVGRIVHRTPFGPHVRHGLRFDPRLSPDFEEQEGRIAEYVGV